MLRSEYDREQSQIVLLTTLVKWLLSLKRTSTHALQMAVPSLLTAPGM